MAEQSIIQIKRSAATEAPASLANGEIAYSFASNTFFIGDMQNGGAPIKIAGGEFNYIDDVTAGTLAAGKALVVNSTSFIDQFKTGSLQVGADTAVTSISTTIGLGSDSVLPTTSAVKAYVDGASSVNSFSFDAASEEITLTTTTGDSFTADLSAFATEAQVATAKGEAATDASTKAATAYTNAVAYTDGREVAITTAYQAYADQAEADAISTAAADATSKANAAQSAAISAAAADATTKAGTAYTNAVSYTDAREVAITSAYQSYADQAEADAISTAAADATSKANAAIANAHAYTDAAVSNLVDTAPEALDTLNELAAALGDDPNFATSIATTIGQGYANAVAYTDGRETAITTAYEAYADQAEADAIAAAALDATSKAATAYSNATSYTDARETAITTAYQAYADQAEADAISAAAIDATSKANAAQSAAIAAAATDASTKANAAYTNAVSYTDGRETAITTAYEAYADQAEADAISTAAADATSKANAAYTNAVSYTDGREVAITTAYQAYADQAEADAISTAAADATSKAGDAYSNAVSTAAADASSKAATAYSNAVSYTDGAVADKITLEDLSGGTGVTYDNLSGEISIGQAVGTTDNVTFNNVTVGGILNSDDITASTVTITGNLVVQGTTTTVNTETIELADNQIVLNSNHTGAPTLDAGFVVERGDESDVSFLWDETNDRWSTGSEGIFAGNITTADAQITGGNISGLSAAIAVADGGTGLSSVTANALLVGNGTSALTELTGSAYQVLQLDASGVPVFGGLDGGTF